MASSPDGDAAIGGNTEGMNDLRALRIDDRERHLVRLPGHQASPDSVALRPEVFALVVEALAVRVDDDAERDAVEPGDDAAIESGRPRIDGNRVALARIADRLRARVEHQPEEGAPCCTAFRE